MVTTNEKQLDTINAYKLLLGDQGQKIVNDLENFCGFKKALFKSGSNSNVHEGLISEGKRLVFLHILKKLEQAKNL